MTEETALVYYYIGTLYSERKDSANSILNYQKSIACIEKK